jgi:hypothetical protein
MTEGSPCGRKATIGHRCVCRCVGSVNKRNGIAASELFVQRFFWVAPRSVRRCKKCARDSKFTGNEKRIATITSISELLIKKNPSLRGKGHGDLLRRLSVKSRIRNCLTETKQCLNQQFNRRRGEQAYCCGAQQQDTNAAYPFAVMAFVKKFFIHSRSFNVVFHAPTMPQDDETVMTVI